MNANYIYKIFETASTHEVDLTIGLEILSSSTPLPEGETKHTINEFVGLHEDLLGRAFRTGHPKLFEDIVQACVDSHEEEADMLLRARDTGNEKLIAEMEAKYGKVGE